jgi:hypothetical protein
MTTLAAPSALLPLLALCGFAPTVFVACRHLDELPETQHLLGLWAATR